MTLESMYFLDPYLHSLSSGHHHSMLIGVPDISPLSPHSSLNSVARLIFLKSTYAHASLKISLFAHYAKFYSLWHAL